jgi:hypothetical protein
MSTSVPSAPAPKVSAEPLIPRLVRIGGILLLVGTIPLVILLPVGPKVVWSVVVAALPLGFTLAGYYAWRRACPLAFFATLGQRLKLQKKRKAGDWLATHGLEVQLGLLVLGMMWRHLGANGTPWALASLLITVLLAATVVGVLFTGKTWCNHICPVGVVEKIYQEPALLLGREGNSQCATCTACKKNCPDIDLEQGYWKEVEWPARRNVYYVWPGLVLAFFVYFYLAAGNWENYFSGAWSRDALLATRLFEPGLFFAPGLPRLAAVPLVFLVFGFASFVIFHLLERFFRARASGAEAEAVARHRCLTLAGFTAFLLFYAFAGQPALLELPVWIRQALSMGIVSIATALLLARWSRSETSFIQEKFAKGLLKRWEWDEAPPSGRLGDLYLLHQERVQQREARLKAYKATVRDLLAEGILTRGNLLVLQKVRAELGISDKDHDKLLSELNLEERRLFDPAYQGSLEKNLQLEQYQHALADLLLADHQPGPEIIESLRQIHRIRPEEHARILSDLRGEQGPLAKRLQASVQAIRGYLEADQGAEGWSASFEEGAPVKALIARVAFFRHVVQWRLRHHLEHVLHVLDSGLEEPGLKEPRLTLVAAKPGATHEVIGLLAAMSAQGALGAALAPLASGFEPRLDQGSVFREMVRDESRYLRAAALALLSELGDAASHRCLREALLDPDPLVREAARSLLGLAGDLDQTLAELAQDDQELMLRAAVLALPLAASSRPDPDRTSLTRQETMVLLHGVPLFSRLDPDDLDILAQAARVSVFAPGASLCRQGERSDDVFLILHGRAQTWAEDQGRQTRLLGDCSEGACLGEMAVLDPAPRAATVLASTEVRALVLTGRAFREALHGHPTVAEGVLRVLTQRLRSLIQSPQSA